MYFFVAVTSTDDLLALSRQQRTVGAWYYFTQPKVSSVHNKNHNATFMFYKQNFFSLFFFFKLKNSFKGIGEGT